MGRLDGFELALPLGPGKPPGAEPLRRFRRSQSIMMLVIRRRRDWTGVGLWTGLAL
jgi:hypothetical protein